MTTRALPGCYGSRITGADRQAIGSISGIGRRDRARSVFEQLDAPGGGGRPATRRLFRRPTFKLSHEINTRSVIENHLAPHFGNKDLAGITEADLLGYVRVKLEARQAPATILNALSILRRVLNLAHRDGLIPRNPAIRLGELMRRVDRRTATEVRTADAWTREEGAGLPLADSSGVTGLAFF